MVATECLSKDGRVICTGSMVRKQHPYDATPQGGRPEGLALRVDSVSENHGAPICHLEDGTWDYAWNLYLVA